MSQVVVLSVQNTITSDLKPTQEEGTAALPISPEEHHCCVLDF